MVKLPELVDDSLLAAVELVLEDSVLKVLTVSLLAVLEELDSLVLELPDGLKDDSELLEVEVSILVLLSKLLEVEVVGVLDNSEKLSVTADAELSLFVTLSLV